MDSKKNNKITKYSSFSKLTFNKQIDLLINNKSSKYVSLILYKKIPQLYKDLGLNNYIITVSSAKMKSIINGNKNHIGIGWINAKKLPKAIKNPLIIIESSTRDNSIVIITELIDIFDNIIIVAMQLDGYGNIEFMDTNNNLFIITKKANSILSSYGKENYNS